MQHMQTAVLKGSRAHQSPVRLGHVLEAVAGVGGDGADPRAPQQGEEPALVNHPEVHSYVPMT